MSASYGNQVDKRFSTLEIIGTNESTSPYTGALIVRGGIGIQGNINIAGTIGSASNPTGGLVASTLQITSGVTVGYVLKAKNNAGLAEWSPVDDDRFLNASVHEISLHKSLGIGVTNPLEQLHLSENLRIEGDLIFPTISDVTINDLITLNNNSYITNSGFIGIGITPTESLHTTGNIRVEGNFKNGSEEYSFPPSTDILTGITSIQTIHNKTLTSPIITGDMDFESSGTLINLTTPVNEKDAATKDYVDNLINGLDWQASVLSKALSSPPGSPVINDRYIIASSATNEWSGHENKIAEWIGSEWLIILPTEGAATLVEDEDTQYNYNGTSWVKFGTLVNHSNLINLNADDHTQYTLLNGRTTGQVLYGGINANETMSIFSTNHTTRGNILLNSDGGNVGIGITNPVHTLHVDGSIGLKNSNISSTNNDLIINTINDNIFLRPNNSTNSQVKIGISGDIHHYDTDGVLTNQISSYQDSYLLKNNLGIGTSNVTERLVIGSNIDTQDNTLLIQGDKNSILRLNSDISNSIPTNVSSIILSSKGDTNKSIISQIGSDDHLVTGSIAESLLIGSVIADEQADIYLATDGNLSVTIKKDSKVGFNQVLPNANVVIQDNLESHNGLTLGLTGDIGIKMGQSVGNYLDIKWNYDLITPYAEITTKNINDDLLLQGNNGNVGIGISQPDDTLHVIGNIKLSGTINQDALVFTLPSTTDTLIGKDTVDVLTNKKLIDTSVSINNQADNTKILDFTLSGATTGKTMTIASSQTDNYTLTLPNISDTLVTKNTVDTLTNKTLSGNIISTFTNTGTYTMPSGSSDTMVARNTVDTLTNKTIVSPVIQGNILQDVGDYVATNHIRARNVDGLALTDDNDTGMFIQDGGNVGVGTSGPTSILHIVGDTTTLDSHLNVDSGVLYVDKTLNRVGINTTLPTTDFHVDGYAEIAQNLTVQGNLIVNGTQTIISTTNINIQDNLVAWAEGNTSDIIDIGFYGAYVETGVTKFTGLFRDASGTKPYRLFKSLEVIPTNTIDLSATGYQKGDLVVDTIDAENITYSTDLAFNTSQMLITSDGNVGINTVTPNTLFHVNGNVQLGSEIYNIPGKLGIHQSSPIADTEINSSMRITATTSSVLTGTADPTGSTTLIGSGTLFLTELIIGDKITINAETRTVTAIASDTSLTVDTAFTDTAPASITKLPASMVIRDSSENIDMIIQEDGMVGIGTHKSIYPLTISKPISGNWSTQIKNGESTIYLGHADGLGANIRTGTLTDTSYSLLVQNDTSTLLRVQNDKKVGIATTNPNELLHVNGSVAGDGAQIGNMKLGVWSGSSDYASIIHNDLKATANSYAISQFNTGETYINAAPSKSIHFMNNHVEKAIFTSNGRLGIGTNTPAQALHVVGGSFVTDDLEVTGDLIVHGELSFFDAENITVQDPVLKLASMNTTDALDIGIYAQYVDTGVTKYTGLFRDKDDKKWKLFKQLEIEPGTTQVEFNGTGYEDADFVCAGIEASGPVQFSKSIRVNVTTVTSNTTLDDTHNIVVCDATSGNITITLPESHDNIPTYIGIKYTIVKKDNSSNKVILSMTNNDIIDGGNSIELITQHDRITLVSIGGVSNIGNWLTI